jgi:chromosome partitioning protein
MLGECFGESVKVYNSQIPSTVKVREANYTSQSVMTYDPKSRAAQAYMEFAKEVAA